MDNVDRHASTVTGMPNVTYDMLSLLQNKLEGITAMEKYKEDAKQAGDQEIQRFLNDLQQRDKQDVDKLKGFLGKHLK